ENTGQDYRSPTASSYNLNSNSKQNFHNSNAHNLNSNFKPNFRDNASRPKPFVKATPYVERNKNWRDRVRCGLCGQSGHYSSNCVEGESNQGDSVNVTKQMSPRRDRGCFTWGGKHIARYCPKNENHKRVNRAFVFRNNNYGNRK